MLESRSPLTRSPRHPTGLPEGHQAPCPQHRHARGRGEGASLGAGPARRDGAHRSFILILGRTVSIYGTKILAVPSEAINHILILGRTVSIYGTKILAVPSEAINHLSVGKDQCFYFSEAPKHCSRRRGAVSLTSSAWEPDAAPSHSEFEGSGNSLCRLSRAVLPRPH
jgi:hypothetical protein